MYGMIETGIKVKTFGNYFFQLYTFIKSLNCNLYDLFNLFID